MRLPALRAPPVVVMSGQMGAGVQVWVGGCSVGTHLQKHPLLPDGVRPEEKERPGAARGGRFGADCIRHETDSLVLDRIGQDRTKRERFGVSVQFLSSRGRGGRFR